MPSGRITSFLLHFRYVVGQLAAGFLLSVPAQLILRGKDAFLVHSLAYGIVFLLGYVLLIPVSRFEWTNITVPEFWRFEITISFWATLVTLVLLLASLVTPLLKSNQHVFWFVFVITFFYWAQRKGYALLFDHWPVKAVAPVDPNAPTVIEGDTKIRRRP